MDNQYPKYVSVLNDSGTVEKVLYKDIKIHEESIIEDNIFYGIKHSNDYSEQEILEYEEQAYSELKELKRAIREDNDIVLKLDKIKERYVLA